jgi:hypothetical protein
MAATEEINSLVLATVRGSVADHNQLASSGLAQVGEAAAVTAWALHKEQVLFEGPSHARAGCCPQLLRVQLLSNVLWQ